MTVAAPHPTGLPPIAMLRETLTTLIRHAAGPTRVAYIAAAGDLTRGLHGTWDAGVLSVPAAPESPIVYQVQHIPGRQPFPWICTCPMGAANWPCAHAALADACVAAWDQLDTDDLPFIDDPLPTLPPAPLLADLALDDPLRAYLNAIGQVPLLSAAEEALLAARLAAGVAAAAQLTTAATHPDRAALTQVVADGDAARDHLIRANLRLVVSMAKRYHSDHLTLLDLVQEGTLGLMRAVEKFEPARGHKFSTYATWWIRQAITRALADQGRTIRLPVHMGEQISQVRRASLALEQQLGRPPTPAEIATTMGVAEARVVQALTAQRQPLSLAMPIGEAGEDTLGDLVADARQVGPETAAGQTLLREALMAAIAELPEREGRVLMLRYGLADGQYRTLEEVGLHFGVTRERIRQIEVIALRKLRHPHLGKRLRGFLQEED